MAFLRGVLGAALLVAATGALANPRGGAVVHGTAAISESGQVMTIDQGSDRAVIDWQGFGNAAGETIRFQHPTASAVTLNRVIGVDPSLIGGALQSNGRLFLINPNGIVFGGTAQVNVGSLVASTLSISDEDFLSGNYRLLPGGSLSAVVNAGRITVAEGGVVALVAPIVNNSGEIVAAAGRVYLAATNGASIPLDAGGYVSLATGAGRGSVRLPTIGLSTLLEDVVNTSSYSTAQRVTRLDDGTTFLRDAEGILVNEGTVSVDGPAASRHGSVLLDATRVITVGPGSRITAGAGTADGTGRIDVHSTQSGVNLAYARTASRPPDPAVLRGDAVDLEVGRGFVSDAQGALRVEGHAVRLSARQGGIGRTGEPVTFDARNLDAFGCGDSALHLLGTVAVGRVIINDLGTTPSLLTITGTGSIVNATTSSGFTARTITINYEGTIGAAGDPVTFGAFTGTLVGGTVLGRETRLRRPRPPIGGDPDPSVGTFSNPGVIGVTEAYVDPGPSGQDESLPPLRLGAPDADPIARPAPAEPPGPSAPSTTVGSRDNILQSTLRSDRVRSRSDSPASGEVRASDPWIQVVGDEDGEGADLDGSRDGAASAEKRRGRR